MFSLDRIQWNINIRYSMSISFELNKLPELKTYCDLTSVLRLVT